MEGKQLTYRKAEETDVPYLLWLRKETMNDHLLRAGLAITDDEHIKRILYQHEGAKLIMLNAQAIGLIKVSEQQNNIEIIQIQIAPQYQGKGIGKQVMLSIIEEAKAKKAALILSVLKENKAKRLYESLGFKTISETYDSFEMKI